MKRMLIAGALALSAATAIGQKADTLDYSYLSFNEVYDLYRSKNIDIVSANDPDLFLEVFSWLNTPYQWGGKTKGGVDCSDLVCSILSKLYNLHLGGAAGDLFNKCDEVMPSELQEGDLVFFNINGRPFSHVGIYLQNGMFAHASVHNGVIISSLDEKYYQHWFYKAGRVRQVMAADNDQTPDAN